MSTYWRLDFLSGDFVLVETPSLLQCDRLRAYHSELQKAIIGLNIWGPETDEDLYSQFKLYYQKIADLVRPSFDCDDLTRESRHLFFVCTTPVEDSNGKLIAGVSGLEQIMGYSYSHSQEPTKKPEYTTGEPSLDILTSVLLIFKRQGLKLAEQFSREDLAKMSVYASEIMKPKEEEKEDVVAVRQNPIIVEEDDLIFTKNSESILKALHAIAVYPPEGF